MEKMSVEEYGSEANEVLKGIEKLHKQIKEYKTGAESFQTAADLLEQVAEREAKIVEEIEDYVAGLYKLDAERVIEEMTDLGGKIKRAQDSPEDDMDRLERVEKVYERMGEAMERMEKICARVEVMEEGYIGVMKRMEALANRLGMKE